MTARTAAVTLPPELVEAARRSVAAGRSASASAYVAESMARREREDSLAALLDDLDAELGPPFAADRTGARRALGVE